MIDMMENDYWLKDIEDWVSAWFLLGFCGDFSRKGSCGPGILVEGSVLYPRFFLCPVASVASTTKSV